jgi:hypothetical protein
MLNGSIRYTLNRIDAVYRGVSGLPVLTSGMVFMSRKKKLRRKKPITDTRFLKRQLPVFQLHR